MPRKAFGFGDFYLMDENLSKNVLHLFIQYILARKDNKPNECIHKGGYKALSTANRERVTWSPHCSSSMPNMLPGTLYLSLIPSPPPCRHSKITSENLALAMLPQIPTPLL